MQTIPPVEDQGVPPATSLVLFALVAVLVGLIVF